MEDSNKLGSIPSFLHGTFADVKRETGKVVRRLKKGERIHEIVAGHSLVPIGSVPGKLVLDGPNPLIGGEPHFHLFALPRLMMLADMPYEAKYADVMQAFFEDMMQQFWSHLVLSTGQSVYDHYRTEANRVRYLQSLLRFRQDYLTANGYFDRLPMMGWNLQGEMTVNITTIFDHPSFIGKYVLGNLDRIQASFSRDELNRILAGTHLFDLISQWDLAPYIGGFDSDGSAFISRS